MRASYSPIDMSNFYRFVGPCTRRRRSLGINIADAWCYNKETLMIVSQFVSQLVDLWTSDLVKWDQPKIVQTQ